MKRRKDKGYVKRDGPRKRWYGILHRDEEGTLRGFIDAGLRMGWSEHGICLWDEPPLHYMPMYRGEGAGKVFGTVYDDGRFIVRIHSKTCPITVNIKEPRETMERGRNHSFTVKPTST